ncbi:cytochrome c biogenesis factor [Desulfosporosinus orientis DSM 765]|uniref:Cytochrome c biogenesis factor n=1 Tax=Desulfosporosinus orientis (strain ATCC 19365 / DSM 765 / NCIMB 8382 / VKM B-1628 / Singapore I) TaxID=768706 RepID=G7WCC3_DESOD|nr:heme lyase CcmF/NrfE family subunit [Desulfosporosinus orientis]AET66245.1 cytochrome c biogenesis factor [Desulfosporosinus orientis DSM 765]
MAEAGYFSIVLALVLSIYGMLAFLISIRTKNQALMGSAKGAVLAVAILSSAASLILVFFLVSGDYSIQYVYEYTSRDLPVFYRFSAWWAGNSGSLLLWLFLLSWYTVIVAYSRKGKLLAPYASGILLFNSAFFLFILAFLTNPFVRVSGWHPGDVVSAGAGMNPMLQNPGMVIHPITTYLGYVGFAIPFAYGMAALITKDSGDEWIKITRRWTVIAWLFLSLGNLAGAQWAYMELGWGGYWGWDPVENASLLPWLTGTAFLHSVMIQERKDMLKVWNVALVSITYVLTLFGTFLVRSGIITSVHAFGSSELGLYFLVFTVLMLAFGIILIVKRSAFLTQGQSFEAFLSKESSFLLNNLVLVGIAFAVLLGTTFPIISEAVQGVKVSVGAPFFNTVSAPLGLALFILMGICPLIAWREATLKGLFDNFLVPIVLTAFAVLDLFLLGIRNPYALAGFGTALFCISTIFLEIILGTRVRQRLTGESFLRSIGKLFLRNRRRYGGYIIHLGMVLMLLGVTGSHTYNVDLTKTVRPGETLQIGSYILKYNYLSEKDLGNLRLAVYASFSVYDRYNGRLLGVVEPQKVYYPTSNQPSTEVGLRSTLKEDLYIVLADWQKDGTATFKVFVNPLVAWLWIGGYVLIFGTIFALWPSLRMRERRQK